MTLFHCPHEREVSELLHGGQWPLATPPELRDHVAVCRRCSDLVVVTQALRGARAVSSDAARLNSPGLLWWRAQLRRRNAAVERVAKPVQGAQIFALLLYVAVVAGLIWTQARQGLQWLTWLTDLPLSRTFRLNALWPAMAAKPDWTATAVLPGLALLVLLSGVIAYFATDRT